MSVRAPLLALPLALGMLLAPVAPAWAGKTLCCVNAQGLNICGDILPPDCYGRAYREVSEQGFTRRQVEAPLTQEQRAQREAEQERKKQEAEVAREERRRNHALLNTYASEKDIDVMRDRALNAVVASAKDDQAKYDEALKRKTKLADELEFYKKKPMPDNLKDQIKANENDLRTLQVAVNAKQVEMDQVKARFAEEKERFLALKQGRTPKPPAPPVAPTPPAPPASR